MEVTQWAIVEVQENLQTITAVERALIMACDRSPTIHETTPAAIRAFFKKDKSVNVLTFLGYSGAEYEDKTEMLTQAGVILSRFDPRRTIVNIGATAEGIGAVYELAKQKGFRTTGIVSTQARDHKVQLAACVDTVFFVKDTTWGGFMRGTKRLSPTSSAMVENSDVLVAIGGGEVARDELTAAKRLGKEVRFIPADMNHRIALERAAKRGEAAPSDFRGAVGMMLSGDLPSKSTSSKSQK